MLLKAYRVLGCKLRMNKKQRKLCNTLMFLVRLIILSIPLYAILMLGVSFSPWQATVAGHSSWILEAMGYHTDIQGIYVNASYPGDVDPFYFMINPDCTGWKSMLFFFALVFAVPGVAMGRRLLGLAFGLPAIYLVNVARVVGVVMAEHSLGVKTAMMIHDFAWQLGLVAAVLIFWVLWMRWARKKKTGILQRLASFWR